MTSIVSDIKEDKITLNFRFSFNRDLIEELKKFQGINIKDELIRYISDEIKGDLRKDNGKIESFIWEHWD